MKNKITKIVLRVPAPVIMAVSIYLSHQPAVPMMPTFWNADKLVHLVCFAALAGAWTLWFSADNWRRHSLRNFFICALIVSLYGIADEYHQSFIPSREASVGDWATDTLGAALGSAAGRYVMCKLALPLWKK